MKLILLLFGLTFQLTGYCTTLRYLPFPDLIDKSNLIVRAVIEDTQPIKRKNQIWTQYHLRILETLRGPSLKEVFMIQPGGLSGVFETFVAGTVKFQNGDDICLFLRESDEGFYQIMGLEQGQFKLISVGPKVIVLLNPNQMAQIPSASSRSIQALEKAENFIQEPSWQRFKEIIKLHVY